MADVLIVGDRVAVEYDLVDLLRQSLPETWSVIAGMALADGRSEPDLVIVGEHQAFVVEVKVSRRRVVAQEWGRRVELLAQQAGQRLAAVSSHPPTPVLAVLVVVGTPDPMVRGASLESLLVTTPATLVEQLVRGDAAAAEVVQRGWAREQVCDLLLFPGAERGRSGLRTGLTRDSAGAGASEALDEVWGPAPTVEALRSGVEHQLRLDFERRRSLESESLTRSQVAELLGKSPQAVTGDLDAGRLVGIRVGRQWLIPAWQLAADSPTGLVPAIGELVRAFPAGPVALTAWVGRTSVDLDGRTPREALLQGDETAVLRLARSLHAAAS